MKTNEIKKDYPIDFKEIPSQDRIRGIFGSRAGDKKSFDIPLHKLAQDLNLSSSGGAPIYFEGNQLPSANSVGEGLKNGDWVILEAGKIYNNINGGDPIFAPLKKVSYAQFDGDHWVLIKISDIPDSSAKIDEWTPNFWVKDTVKTYLGDIYRAKQDTDTVPVNNLFWDKIGGTTNNLNISFGGVIDDTYDLSTPPTEPTWYIAISGTYNTTPPTILTETSILTWNGQSWSHIPFELEVRGEFLVADNIQELRNITPEVAQLLVNGTYKGVTVLGYYQPGDTPSSINYYLSDTTSLDNGGSVIEAGGVKFESDQVYYNPNYFGIGIDKDTEQDITPYFKSYINHFGDMGFGKINLNGGVYKITERLELPTNTFIDGGGADITAVNTVGFSFINKQNITIKSVKIGVDSTNENHYAIYGENSNGIRIHKVECFKGITAARFLNCNMVWCTENIVHDMLYWGFYHLGGSDIFIQRNICYDNGRDGIKVAGNLSSGGALTINNLNRRRSISWLIISQNSNTFISSIN